MLNLVTNILDVQRFDEAKMPVAPQPVDLREVAASAIEQVSFLARGRRLENDLPSGTSVWIDPELVSRVFVNLLTNAIKFTAEDGRIVLRQVQDEDEGFVRVEVEDDGAGIPASKLGHVFDRFTQAQARDSGSTRSTGLGLTFCRQAVEALGGRIGVTSKALEGTTFWLTLRKAGLGSAGGVRATESILPVLRAEPILTAEEKRLLAPYAAELAAIPIYRVSALNAVLARLDADLGERGSSWSSRVRDAVFLADEARFRALLEEI